MFKTVLKDLPIRGKLFSLIILMIIIPLLIAAVIINLKTSEILRESINKSVFETMKRTRFSVSEIVNGAEDLSLEIIAEGNMQNLLSRYHHNEMDIGMPLSVDRSDIQAELLELQDIFSRKPEYKESVYKTGFAATILPRFKSMPFIDSVSVSYDGDIVCQLGGILHKEDTSYFSEAMILNGPAFWTPVYKLTNRSDQGPPLEVISLVRVIRDLNTSTTLGIQRISISERELEGAYQSIDSWEDGSVQIVASDGSIISSTNKNTLNQQFDRSILDEMKRSGDEGYFRRLSDSREHIWYFFYKIKDVDWTVLQAIPERDLNIQLKTTNLIVFMSILFCLIFGFFFSILLNSWVAKPLSALTDEMEKVKTGIFEVDIESRSNDEIGKVINQFKDMTGEVRGLIDEVYNTKIKEREAELAAMQAQINPHFLYNTLDNIRWVALKEGADTAGDQIEILSNLFRYILSSGEEDIPIKDEIKHLEYYIAIQKNRFKERLHVTINTDDEVLKYSMVKLMLQPLVENSIEHGFRNEVGTGNIRISAEKTGDLIHFVVRDDGNGADEAAIRNLLEDEDETFGFSALKNINDRIHLRYGREYGLQFHSTVGEGTVVEVRIPAVEIKSGQNDERNHR